MRIIPLFITIFITSFFVSCEEVIDISLNSTNPKVVIEADLDDLSTNQVIKLSRTVDFNLEVPNQPIYDAAVSVLDDRGRLYVFQHAGAGRYERNNFELREGRTYMLTVEVDGEVYESSAKMANYVNIDSIGVLKDDIFNETYYSVNLKFNDPINVNNYYKYSVSVNESPFKFSNVFSDKFNDGLFVSHQITDLVNPYEIGDTVVIKRSSVTREVFNFWSEFQMTNPGSAAPSNPTSNISNGALGYFSVSSTKVYGVRIKEFEE